MKKIILQFGTAALLVLSNHLSAQKNDGVQLFNCGTPIPDSKWDDWFNQKVAEFKSGRATIVNYTIPVIMHVIHGGQPVGTFPNLSNAQLVSEIQVLNDDYSGKGYNSNTVPSTFSSLVANSGVQFCLATKDPQGNTLAEPGIERINYNSKGWSNPASQPDDNSLTNYINGTIKPGSIWDPTKYLNMWITDRDNGGTLLGYATFPAGTGLTGLTSGIGTATDDGFWCYAKCFGTTGTLLSGYDKGRVCSHEIGHYLGLRHIWGDANCATDYCNDTPPSQQANYGCPTFPHNQGTCSGNTTGEMTMNIMDYTSDACKYMFTPDQVTRIQTTMANGTYRKLLGTHGLCSTGPSAPVADFISNKTAVCPGTTITFTDKSTNAPTSWSWSFPGGTPSTSTAQNPTVTYSSVGSYNVQLVATNATGNNTKLKNLYITVSGINALPLSEGFANTNFPPTNWSEINIDADTIFWQRKSGVGGFGTSTSCMMFDNYNQDAQGKRDEIRTPKYNFSGSTGAVLTFDVAFARLNSSQIDSLAVLVSTDCGSTFTEIYSKGGTTLATAPDKLSPIFVPTNSQWRTETVLLNSYAGQSDVMLSFQNRGHYGQALYIDNINITGSTSIATKENANSSLVLSPNPTEGKFEVHLILPEKENVKIEIENILGQVVLSEVVSQTNEIHHSVDLSDKDAGIYFVKISYGENQLSKKIIKK